MIKNAANQRWVGELSESPIGPVSIALSPNGLASIEIGCSGDSFIQNLSSRNRVDIKIDSNRVLPVLKQIEAYLTGKRIRFDLPLDWSVMSIFQCQVLQEVLKIPYSETQSYGQIAVQIGMPRASRAVGRANATNPIPLVIPCHRVIGADGSLRGYGSGEGIKTKAWLLSMERSHSLQSQADGRISER